MREQISENIETLQRGASLLRRINDHAYQERVHAVFMGSIGAHVRHNLDHYVSLLDGLVVARVDYEARARDTLVEIDRELAISEIVRVCRRLEAIPDPDTHLQVRVCGATSESGGWAATSVARELDFLLSHTIHHYAIVAISCQLLGVAIDKGFGAAPSTLRYWASIDPRAP